LGRTIAFAGALGLLGTQLVSCDQTPPIDQNFDSSLGDDFKAPATVDAAPDGAADAGSDAGTP
jgi:hypothetical protein